MKRFIRYVLPVVVSMLLTWFAPSATREAVPETLGHALVDLLPESTVAAVELRGLDRRWTEIRNLPAVAHFQDRVLGELGLDGDDLPRLAGNRAVLALVISDNRRDVLPIVVLRPARLPDTLPPGVAAMAAFRLESEANLAWLRHVSMRDPRG